MRKQTIFQNVLPVLAIGLCPWIPTFAASGEGQPDAGLPEYAKTEGVAGNLNSIGSDTLNNLMTYWAEDFRKQYPSVNIQVQGMGSNTAPIALTRGTAQFGPMSREMKNTEIDEFEKKFGYKPLAVKVAVDALAVFVHKDNPIQGLNFPQVDACFSKTLFFKYNVQFDQGQPINDWGGLGLKGDWEKRPISLFGRNSASGTYVYFKEHALKKGDYKDTVKEQSGSASVVQSVATDLYAMGYSGIGYATPGVRAVPLAQKGNKYIAATAENCYSGAYPLSRFLFIYINKNPSKPLDPLVREFLKFVLSKQGQQIVVKDGYYPIPASVAGETRKALEP